MGFDGAFVGDRLHGMLAEVQPGGVILFARNIESPSQTHRLLYDCQAALAGPAFLCVDMEGGTVDRLKNVVYPAPSAVEVFGTVDRKLFRTHGRIIGDECRALGFNTDFAPVLDLAFAPSQPVLGSRVVSPDPKQAVLYAREFLRGLADARVIGCGKHFPGLGEANLDTHHELPSIAKSWRKLGTQDLAPYRALRAKLPFVMVAHAAYPDVTGDRVPASLSSKWMGDILRKKVGYRGLAISDDLEMGGVLANTSIEEAAVETLRAGADIYLVCHNEGHVMGTYAAVVKEAERDAKFATLVEARARRVLAYKKKVRGWLKQSSPPTAQKVEQLRKRLRRFEQDVHRRLAF
ncbi:MAG: beta-N-acetylhexosaminidase [Candidatus Koribacter versatilis]|uniref:Beta-N-acetylhexosaminidase n=1 Tax=Candidatus Korobacter versatilis TaxID=658062 RepID=A0A932A798_9BACT|nr:beta-N-acetylhexosaminidase [Candidatus Koribacter versatilis]